MIFGNMKCWIMEIWRNDKWNMENGEWDMEKWEWRNGKWNCVVEKWGNGN